MTKKRGSNASAISDRSGKRYPMNQMVIEPGTGYLVHRSESDGQWNQVDHPQRNLQKFVRFSDPKPNLNAHPDVNHVLDIFLLDEFSEFVLDEYEQPVDAP
jgi:hypothetical protein